MKLNISSLRFYFYTLHVACRNTYFLFLPDTEKRLDKPTAK